MQNAEKSAPPTKRKKMDEMPSLREEIEAMPKDETQVVPDVSQFTVYMYCKHIIFCVYAIWGKVVFEHVGVDS